MKHTVIDSPVGPLTLVARGQALTGLYMSDQRHRPGEESFGERDDTCAVFADAADQLDEYFAGERTAFDLPVAPVGTPFQLEVWSLLQAIPYGRTTTYGALARRLGKPEAARAVGLANGKNPIGIVIPCHRVVGSTGDLTGYGGGLPRKRQLLALEQALF